MAVAYSLPRRRPHYPETEKIGCRAMMYAADEVILVLLSMLVPSLLPCTRSSWPVWKNGLEDQAKQDYSAWSSNAW